MSVEVDTSRLNRILRNVDGDMADVVATVGFAIEREYKKNVPVDTGATRSSTMTKLPNGNPTPAAWAGVAYVDLPEPHKGEAIVGPTTNYAIHIELGTESMAARPVLMQAVATVTRDIDGIIRTPARRALEGT